MAFIKSILSGALPGLILACGDGESPVGVPAPGAPARIVLEESSYEGGQGMRSTLVVDSASSTFSVATCTESAGETCVATTVTWSGDTPVGVRDGLFALQDTKEFRGLRHEYRRADTVNPPDPYTAKLTITANERRRTIEWENGAKVPGVLVHYTCYVQSATGEIVVCPLPE